MVERIPSTEQRDFDRYLTRVRRCGLCDDLPLGPKPILQAHAAARILIAGQAPGRRAHERGVPFDDPSGDRLQTWLGVHRATFYDPSTFAILPMGFCYPGTGTSGDLPPRIEVTLVIGAFAQGWHLQGETGSSI